MKYLTPTQWARDGGNRPPAEYPTGPAGVPIPPERAVFRKTIDGALLGRIVSAAYDDHVTFAIEPVEHATAAVDLAEGIAEAFPPADMAILERYGFATPVESVSVSIDFRGRAERAQTIKLPWPVLMPYGRGHCRMTFEGASIAATNAMPVPAAIEPYFAKVVSLRHAKAEFDAAKGFPGQFRVKQGRWPRWHEIERAHPLIGGWLAAQRKEMM